MKAAFGVEAIGLGASTKVTARTLGMERQFHRIARPWLAEIVGLTGRHLFRREFLKPKVDYRDANSAGTRGVWFWWTLESGRAYEAQYRTAWDLSSQRRRLLMVDAVGDVVDVEAGQVRRWLECRSRVGVRTLVRRGR